MKCPVCKEINLVMSERKEIEIDYCPKCRGIWLDRGELDKIIEKSNNSDTMLNDNQNKYEKEYNSEYHNDKKYENKNEYYDKSGKKRIENHF